MTHTWPMKRRYTILFFVALSPLIGLSWFAAQYDTSVWMFRSLGMYGLILAAGAAAYALIRRVTTKTPAVVAAVGSALLTLQTVAHFFDYLRFAADLGFPLALAVIGTPATFVTAVAIAVMKPPVERSSIAAARVVD